MSWTNGEPLIATKEHVELPWSGQKDNFRCGFCGHMIKEGELWVFVSTNDIPGCGGNPFACYKCIQSVLPQLINDHQDGQTHKTCHEALRERWREQCEE